MRLLLDTHAALWAVSQPDALSAAADDAIAGADAIRLSVVSAWEAIIKSSLGKLVLRGTVREICRELEREFGAETLDVSVAHVLEVGQLPPLHGDPFDRLLVAQARVEGLTVVTRDSIFAEYGVEMIRA